MAQRCSNGACAVAFYDRSWGNGGIWHDLTPCPPHARRCHASRRCDRPCLAAAQSFTSSRVSGRILTRCCTTAVSSSSLAHVEVALSARFVCRTLAICTTVDGNRKEISIIETPRRSSTPGVRLRSHRGSRPRTYYALHHYVRRAVDTHDHPIGTCRMGIDDIAAVTPELTVGGLTGLGVAIMPSVTSGSINAPSIMIGEKAADVLSGHTMTKYGRRH